MATLDSLAKRAADISPIKAPALNLTLGSGLAAAVAAAAVIFNSTYKKIFGFSPGTHPNVTTAILIAVIGSYALIASADLIARSRSAAAPVDSQLAPAPKGWTATVNKDGRDDGPFNVTAIRVGAAQLEYLLDRTDVGPGWYAQSAIKLTVPTG